MLIFDLYSFSFIFHHYIIIFNYALKYEQLLRINKTLLILFVNENLITIFTFFVEFLYIFFFYFVCIVINKSINKFCSLKYRFAPKHCRYDCFLSILLTHLIKFIMAYFGRLGMRKPLAKISNNI